ncbi:MAG: enoyl-CoA hydratase/isomerase family protein, partial [Pollutimonas bauzanensis]
MSNSIDETTPPILIEHDSQVCLIALNRPKSFNAVTFEMLDHLNRVLDQEERNPAVRTIVLTGAGQGFCAGADLKDLKKRTEGLSDSEAAEANGKFSAEFGRFLARLESFPKPVVAAVNGVAVAGGLEILLCCDLIIAARSARIGDAHSNYGLLPGGGATARLPRRVGVSLAKYLLYTG